MTQQEFKIGVEITLKDPDSFLIVSESLTRIGVLSTQTSSLYQSCHILHKRGKYFICHFKSLMQLDMRVVDIDENDLRRTSTIAKMLESWGLCTVVDRADIELTVPISEISVIPFRDKKNYTLVHKYTVGKKR